jgi:SRSO17 transposase
MPGHSIESCSNCHYAERTLAWPVATRLYLPAEWAADEARRQQAHVPAAVKFQTKAELALALLDEAKACGVPHACVTCDADFGDNPHFLNRLEAHGEYYVAAVRADFSVTLRRGPASPVQRADTVLAAQPRRDWQTMAWSAGAQGW